MSRHSNFLDADENMRDQNLKFVRNDFEDNINQYFTNGPQASSVAPPRDYKVVQPVAGFCIKSYKVNTCEKYFINVCQTPEIPAPEDVTEDELNKILTSDTPSSFRIPMSISEPRIAKDNSNNDVEVCDIAINPKFLVKCVESELFKNFFVTLIAEALSEKYNVQISIEKLIILNNRKVMGKLISHRVRNNDLKNVLKYYANPTESDKNNLQQLEEIAAASCNTEKSEPLVQEIGAQELKLLQKNQVITTQPEFKLRARIRQDKVEEIQAELYLPKCVSSHDVNLDIGEDRILLESTKCGYIFDKFVNYRLNQARAKAIFDKTNKMLQIRIPVYAAQ